MPTDAGFNKCHVISRNTGKCKLGWFIQIVYHYVQINMYTLIYVQMLHTFSSASIWSYSHFIFSSRITCRNNSFKYTLYSIELLHITGPYSQ